MCIKRILLLGFLLFFINAWTQRLALLGQMNLFDTIQLNQSTPILPRLNTKQSIPKARIIPIIDLGLRYNPSISGKASTGFLWDSQRSKWFMRVGGGVGINTVLPAGFVQNGISLAQNNTLAFNVRPIIRLGITPSTYISAQLGFDQNFYGDGYRSLFLSDAGRPYPFTSLRFNIGPVTYQAMGMYLNSVGDQHKYGINHYLHLRLGKHIRLALFEAVIFNSGDALSNRSFDPSYLNPFMIIRPSEYSTGSGDNVLLGGEISVYSKKGTWYGQLIVDDLLMKALLQREQYWGNKLGGQVGWKYLTQKKNHTIHLRSEFNMVRPYTYSHIGNQLSYTVNQQVLAHPKGANFWEIFSRIDFISKRWGAMAELAVGQKGIGAPYGGDVLAPYTLRPGDYNVSLLQGVKTKQLNVRIQGIRMLKQWYNTQLFVELSGTYTGEGPNGRFHCSPILGLRSAIWNDYRF
jgi:hypothetical protein